MTIDSGHSDYPDRRLYEITYFSRYGYEEYRSVYLKLPVLPTHTYLPGDYRSRKEIEETERERPETFDIQKKLEDALMKLAK